MFKFFHRQAFIRTVCSYFIHRQDIITGKYSIYFMKCHKEDTHLKKLDFCVKYREKFNFGGTVAIVGEIATA
ncbi:hypothetical protein HMPREF0877_1436 [Weissella paramesenteroides ATCC 33313]|uniref:Uncharacterized protein n=1 Tax=Weissella paramesenteroides ATCC 33313 TaxID=585506 RepID=C5RBU0_WEIPA|nr:hypothetical protein HMPREF0877_1436 [Weissella paramesenteroides ATCC 33313]